MTAPDDRRAEGPEGLNRPPDGSAPDDRRAEGPEGLNRPPAEAFIAAHAALDRFDPQRPMRAWLARIAINKARDWQRRRRVRRLISAFLSADMVERADDAPSPEDEAQGKDELRRVKAAIARLPRNLREVLVLRTIDEMSQAETALALGLNEKSVEMRLYRARQRLKDEFDRKRV